MSNNNLYIKVGSITNAQRAKSVLMKNSITSEIKRIEDPKPGDGCGYIIKVKKSEESKAISILQKNGIRIIGEDFE